MIEPTLMTLKRCVAFIALIFLVPILLYIFGMDWFIPEVILSNPPVHRASSPVHPSPPPIQSPVKADVKKHFEPGKFPYAEREAFYHNTLDMDFLHKEDFEKEPPPDSQLSTRREIIKAKIIRAERHYQKKVAERNKSYPTPSQVGNHESLQNIFKPDFDCPFLKEKVGPADDATSESKWICGFELYRTEPKPQECVVYVFEGSPKLEFEMQWLQKTECAVLKFQFTGPLKNISNLKHLEVFPNLSIGTSISGNMKTLRRILKENEHGWTDVLVLDIGEQIYPIFQHLIQDFSIQVLPFAQLIIKFPTGDRKKFIDMFLALEKQRLRPFHVNYYKESFEALEYSFFNLRGKHLLLVGEE